MKSTNVVSFHSPYSKNFNFVLVKTNGTIFKVYKNLDIAITYSNEVLLTDVLLERVPYKCGLYSEFLCVYIHTSTSRYCIKMAKFVRCVQLHCVCVLFEDNTLHPSVDHIPDSLLGKII